MHATLAKQEAAWERICRAMGVPFFSLLASSPHNSMQTLVRVRYAFPVNTGEYEISIENAAAVRGRDIRCTIQTTETTSLVMVLEKHSAESMMFQVENPTPYLIAGSLTMTWYGPNNTFSETINFSLRSGQSTYSMLRMNPTTEFVKYLIGGTLFMKLTYELTKPMVRISETPVVSMGKQFGALFGQTQGSDVTILGADNHSLPAHQLVLQVRSDFFRAMLSCPMKESVTKTIDMTMYPWEAVRRLIQYMYDDQMPEVNTLTQPELLQLILAAHYYQLPSVQLYCEQQWIDVQEFSTASLDPDELPDGLLKDQCSHFKIPRIN